MKRTVAALFAALCAACAAAEPVETPELPDFFALLPDARIAAGAVRTPR